MIAVTYDSCSVQKTKNKNGNLLNIEVTVPGLQTNEKRNIEVMMGSKSLALSG